MRRVLIVEIPMLHRSFLYTGTPDLLVEMEDGNLVLCDYKTVPNAEKAHNAMLWWLEYHGLTQALQFNKDNPPDIGGKESRSWRKRSEWVLQLAAYRELIRANHGFVVERAGNIVLNDNRFRLLPYNKADLKQAWGRYAGFLREYHTRQAGLGNPVSQLALPAVEALFA